MKDRVVSAMLNESIQTDKELFAEMLKKHKGNCPCCKGKWPRNHKPRQKTSFRVYDQVAELLDKHPEVSSYAAAVIEWESGICPVCGGKR